MHVELTEEEKIKIMNSDDVFQVMKKVLLRENKVDQDKEFIREEIRASFRYD